MATSHSALPIGSSQEGEIKKQPHWLEKAETLLKEKKTIFPCWSTRETNNRPIEEEEIQFIQNVLLAKEIILEKIDLRWLVIDSKAMTSLCEALESKTCPENMWLDFTLCSITAEAYKVLATFIQNGRYATGLTINLNISVDRIDPSGLDDCFMSALIQDKNPDLKLIISDNFYCKVLKGHRRFYNLLQHCQFLKSLSIQTLCQNFYRGDRSLSKHLTAQLLKANISLVALEIPNEFYYDTSDELVDFSSTIDVIIKRNLKFGETQNKFKKYFLDNFHDLFPTEINRLVWEYTGDEVPLSPAICEEMLELAVKEFSDGAAVFEGTAFNNFYTILKYYWQDWSSIFIRYPEFKPIFQENLHLFLQAVRGIQLNLFCIDPNTSQAEISSFIELAEFKEAPPTEVANYLMPPTHLKPVADVNMCIGFDEKVNSSPVTLTPFTRLSAYLGAPPGLKIAISKISISNKKLPFPLLEKFLSDKSCPEALDLSIERGIVENSLKKIAKIISLGHYPKNFRLQLQLSTKNITFPPLPPPFYKALTTPQNLKAPALHLEVNYIFFSTRSSFVPINISIRHGKLVTLIVHNKNLKSLSISGLEIKEIPPPPLLRAALLVNEKLTHFNLFAEQQNVFYPSSSYDLYSSRNRKYEQGILDPRMDIPKQVVKAFYDEIKKPTTSQFGFHVLINAIHRDKDYLTEIFSKENFRKIFRQNMSEFIYFLACCNGMTKKLFIDDLHIIITAAAISFAERTALMAKLANPPTFELSLSGEELLSLECSLPVTSRPSPALLEEKKPAAVGLFSLEIKHPVPSRPFIKGCNQEIVGILEFYCDFTISENTFKVYTDFASKGEVKKYRNYVVKNFRDKKISLMCAIELMNVCNRESQTISLCDLEKIILDYHNAKGNYRKFFNTATQTVKGLTALLELAKEGKWKNIHQSQVNLCLHARDMRKRSFSSFFFRKGSIKNTVTFFKTGTIEDFKLLSQTEYLIYKIHKKQHASSL